MKKILFLALIMSLMVFNSCSVEDNVSDIQFQFEFIPIDSVEIPTTFNYGDTHTISVTYKRPSTCHTFSNFEYEQSTGNLRTVAVVNFVTFGNGCEPLEEEFETKTFSFNALSIEPYTFRFWQGKDDDGQDTYLIYEVPVNNN
ncbi:hypothetical protein C8N46_10615 [Kordia periserrulae]|uniref:Lipoprotein n=1 Tax=Kordia periserrulae TaxID=701523 RepID=A0A2T6BWC4_9FLAO|nr:hypothetical protein [Kordia periserrulae]PTX60371.1 hypothetical protein C8N46_10615 [Kordia periserrulae]